MICIHFWKWLVERETSCNWTNGSISKNGGLYARMTDENIYCILHLLYQKYVN